MAQEQRGLDEAFGRSNNNVRSVPGTRKSSRQLGKAYEQWAVKIAGGGVIVTLVALWCSGAYWFADFVVDRVPAIDRWWPMMWLLQLIITLIQIYLNPLKTRIWIVVVVWLVFSLIDIGTNVTGASSVFLSPLGLVTGWIVSIVYGTATALLPEPGIRAAWPIMTQGRLQ